MPRAAHQLRRLYAALLRRTREHGPHFGVHRDRGSLVEHTNLKLDAALRGHRATQRSGPLFERSAFARVGVAQDDRKDDETRHDVDLIGLLPYLTDGHYR